MEPRLKEWIENALTDFFNSVDSSLIDRKLKEECINHRLACRIEGSKPEPYLDYYIDIEYNKNINEVKKTPRRLAGVQPDIIVHRRERNDENILVAEIKGWWNDNSRNDDYMKLYLNVRRFRGASAASQSRFARCVNRRGSPTLHQPDSPIVTVCAAASPGTNRANHGSQVMHGCSADALTRAIRILKI